jgi:predicted permease
MPQLHPLKGVSQDIRYAIRLLRRSPVFALAAILTLAIGIGANTAIFTVVHAVLLNPLPYPNAERLAVIWSGIGDAQRAPSSGYELKLIRERSQLFDQIEGIWTTNATAPGDGEPEQIKIGDVTPGFLSLLCARPAAGRLFTRNDVGPNVTTNVAIISYALWQRRFGRDPGLIGRPLRVGQNSLEIIGVLPRNFSLVFPDNMPAIVDAYVPLSEANWKPGGSSFLTTIGRLRPGTNFAQAQSEADGIAADLRRVAQEFADVNLQLHVVPLHEDDVRLVRPALLMLFSAVCFVLVIACANVANLLLARASLRGREISIRAALGAPRLRSIRQLLTESVVVGVFGGLAAVAIGWAALKALIALGPQSLLRLAPIHLDFAVFAYTFALAVVTGIAFGLVPALSASRVDLVAALRSAGRGAVAAHKPRFRALLIATEVALSFALLTGTLLLARTFISITRVNPGFQPANVLTFTTSAGDYNFVRQFRQSLLTIPGIEAASVTSHLPLDDAGNWYDSYYPEGTPPERQNTTLADDRSILPGFFSTIGATLLEGRDFTDSDDAAHQHVAIIDDALAAQTWPGQDPLGKKLNMSDSPKGFYEFERDWVGVVGVVKHIQFHSLTNMVRPQIYVPFQLAPRPVSFVVRSSVPPASLIAPIRAQLAKINKRAPLARVAPLDDLVARAQAESRFVAFLAAALAFVALALACIGIAGVTSCSVAQRTGEIGIRMSLGAGPASIVRLIFGQNFAPILAGLFAGLAISFALTPLLQGLLFGVKPSDPLTFAAIFAFLAAIGALACYLPARHATRIDPINALRSL